ncbi:Spore coat polysaccharide biosynthesis protein SpsA [Paraurantiacibacter namhicola]|uniref:Spore coat polysaccharide biosynthesis protein SpsA n=2 Tax=Paraurantiacibacter namhicola TaxID=645517 RepID=A0A1C7D6I0_9SPHN|nr:Spore coat polysaccharide biosynthesis protein SpsA [Paraurantiacibacter namhicola]
MRISIALATFNGARFLAAQLQSLAAQSHPPFEIVIGDDGSRDETLAIIASFSAISDIPVRLLDGAGPSGPSANFARIAAACRGDVIAFCDQDDIWRADKLASLSRAFAAKPAPWVAVHDARIVDSEGEDTGLTLSGQARAAGEGTQALVAGCCMAFDARLQPAFAMQPFAMREHDAWLPGFAAHFGLANWTDDTLVDYRRHRDNVSQGWISQTAQASRLSPFADRLSRARREPIRGRLEAEELQLCAMLELGSGLRSELESEIGGARYGAGMESLWKDERAASLRLQAISEPALRRPFHIARAAASGAYRKGGLGSMIRDLLA